MVTYDKKQWINYSVNSNGTPKMYVEGTCLSTDEKPTDVENGSKLIEVDTSSVYIFDAQNNVWRKW